MQRTPGLAAVRVHQEKLEKAGNRGLDPSQGTQVRIRPLDRDCAVVTPAMTKPAWSLTPSSKFAAIKLGGSRHFEVQSWNSEMLGMDLTLISFPWSFCWQSPEHTGTQSHPFSWVFHPQLDLAFLCEIEIRRNV